MLVDMPALVPQGVFASGAVAEIIRLLITKCS
jgi:hypothetical protein